MKENWEDPTFFSSQINDYGDRLDTSGVVWDPHDMRILAGVVRLADVEGERVDYVSEAEARGFLERLEKYLSRQESYSFGFDLTNNILQYAYDDSENWRIGALSSDRKKWCVEQILGRLKEIASTHDVSAKAGTVLLEVDSIITRALGEGTLSNQPETYIGREDLIEVIDLLDKYPWMREVINDERRRIIQEVTDRFNTRQFGQEKSGQD